ncbi:hypothetical protein IJU22_00700 [Candidatus Saccharibacteria bacterium]|nr:hypothetical protein [Candidatus Saccharibacteria bacterium]
MFNFKAISKKCASFGLAVLMLASSSQTALAKEMHVSEDLSDYNRSLEEKFTAPNEDYIFDFEHDFKENSSVSYVLTPEQLKSKPGTVIIEGNESDDNLERCRYVISVPTIKQDGKTTSKLNDYGMIAIFSYGISMGQYEDYYANLDLLLFDKDFATKHPIEIGFSSVGPYINTTVPYLLVSLYTKDYEAPEEVEQMSTYEASYYSSWFGEESWWEEDPKNVSFTDRSIDLSKKDLDQIIWRTQLCNLLCRDKLESFDHGDSFDYSRLFNDYSSPLAGQFTKKGGYNGFSYIMPSNNPATVIAFTENKIFLGISARWLPDDLDPNVENDILYTALVYEDKAENPEMVKINNYDSLTRGTLDEILYLLTDSGINWAGLNALDLKD